MCSSDCSKQRLLVGVSPTATTHDTLFVWLGRCTGGRREDVQKSHKSSRASDCKTLASLGRRRSNAPVPRRIPTKKKTTTSRPCDRDGQRGPEFCAKLSSDSSYKQENRYKTRGPTARARGRAVRAPPRARAREATPDAVVGAARRIATIANVAHTPRARSRPSRRRRALRRPAQSSQCPGRAARRTPVQRAPAPALKSKFYGSF